MLKDGTGFKRVIVCCGRVDLRKGIQGLTAFVRLNYGLDTTEKGTLFLFCGNRADRIKGLLFEGDGMLLLTKRQRDRLPKDFVHFLTCVFSSLDTFIHFL